jgi:hypothetical protein
MHDSRLGSKRYGIVTRTRLRGCFRPWREYSVAYSLAERTLSLAHDMHKARWDCQHPPTAGRTGGVDEVLSRPLRDGATDEVRILAGLLARLDLRPVDRAPAELGARKRGICRPSRPAEPVPSRPITAWAGPAAG